MCRILASETKNILNLENRVEFLKNYVDDVLQGNQKSFREYALDWLPQYEPKKGGRKLSNMWRTLRSSYKKGEWGNSETISEDWKTKVVEAINKRMTESSGVDLSNFTVTKVYEQQSPDGVIQLKSWERNKDKESLDKSLDEALKTFKEVALDYIPNPYVARQPIGGNYGMNLLIADKHIGAYADIPMFGIKKNYSVSANKSLKWFEVVKENVERFGKLKVLNLIDLGDGVDGIHNKTTSNTHSLPQEGRSEDQYDNYIKTHIDFIDNILKNEFAEKIRYIVCTNSNHGGAWEYAAARSLEIYLNAKYPQVETIISRDFIFHVQDGKKVHIFTHGKPSHQEVSMRSGLPFKLTPAAENFIDSYIAYHGLNKGIHPSEEKTMITLYKGDLHQSGEEYANRFRYKNIMSFVGDTAYSLYNFSKGWGYSGFEAEVFSTDGQDMFNFKYFY